MFRVMEKSHDNFVALEAGGDITTDELLQVEKDLEERIQKHGKINWMCVWKGKAYSNVGTFYKDMMWLLKNIKHFDRMAIVGDAWWKKLLVEADGLVFGEKYFDVSQEEEAWNYVQGK